MKQSTKRAVRLTALAAALAVSLTGCCWEDYFASSEPGGVTSSSSSGSTTTPDDSTHTPPTTDPDEPTEPVWPAKDTSTKENGVSYKMLDNTGNVRLDSVGSDTREIVIDENEQVEIKGQKYTVKEIASNAFSEATSLSNVTFPLSLCSDLNEAIGNSKNDIRITITKSPDSSVIPSDTSTSAGAFEGNEKIVSVGFAEGITMIGSAAFKNCENLCEVYFPNTLKSIQRLAFAGCDAFKAGGNGKVSYAGEEKTWKQLKDDGYFAGDAWSVDGSYWPDVKCGVPVPGTDTVPDSSLPSLISRLANY